MSEVKMPDAAEEAIDIGAELLEHVEREYGYSSSRELLVTFKRALSCGIADIQRRTILACADAVLACDIYDEVERRAASLGEPGKEQGR